MSRSAGWWNTGGTGCATTRASLRSTRPGAATGRLSCRRVEAASEGAAATKAGATSSVWRDAKESTEAMASSDAVGSACWLRTSP